jgi:Uma2 family endonuclease
MSYATVPEPDRLTVEEYLNREVVAEQKHEYVAGWLYAFAGASRRHNIVVSRLLQRFLNATEGVDCQVFTSDMLVRAAGDIFYYPDITVACDPTDDHARYVERPCLVVEVLSTSTAPKDLREKLVVYRNIPTLQGYLNVAPQDGWLELHRRDADGAWRHERADLDETISLPCLPVELDAAALLADLPPSMD